MRLFNRILFVTFGIGFAILLVAGIMYGVNRLFRVDFYFNTTAAHFAYVGIITMMCALLSKGIHSAIQTFKEFEENE